VFFQPSIAFVSVIRTVQSRILVSLGFDGQSEAVKKLRSGLEASLSNFGIHVLTGEAGSGRTRAARYLWAASAREGRFVAVIDRLSFEEAIGEKNTGCLFINEIGLVEPDLQMALLQMVQEKAESERPVLMCTSSWTPARLVQDRRLTEAFGAILASCHLTVPPARDRYEDLAALCAVWVGQGNSSVVLHQDCLAWLARQDWPGNFRQMRQLLHHACHNSPEGVVTAARLADWYRVDTVSDTASFQGLMARYLPSMLDLETDIQGTLHARVLAEVERPLFRFVLKATEGNQIRAAALLGLNRNTLRKRLQLLGIDVSGFRS